MYNIKRKPYYSHTEQTLGSGHFWCTGTLWRGRCHAGLYEEKQPPVYFQCSTSEISLVQNKQVSLYNNI